MEMMIGLLLLGFGIVGVLLCWRFINDKKSISEKNALQNKRLKETTKMVKKILLNNKWENIDEIIEFLRDNSVQINFKLR